MWHKFTIVNVLLAKTIICGEIGDKCVPNDKASEGSCKLITDCAVAMRAIYYLSVHPFTRCGFSDIMEIVCCPTKEYILPELANKNTTSTVHTTTQLAVTKFDKDQPKRIADIECQKIVNTSEPALDIHIVGGVMASLGEFPHMVALGYNRVEKDHEFQCGGSLISDTYILTAAHCVDTLDSIKPTIVRMGVIDIGQRTFNEQTDVRVADIIIHPKYTRRNKYHDLALIRLEKAVQFSVTLRPICLYTLKDDPSKVLTVTGWGKMSVIRDTGSDMLLKADVAVVPKNKCRESYSEWRRLPDGISDEQICAGDPQGLRDTCQGDSGGPLQGLTDSDGHYRLVGVTSFGRGCGSTVPGVYSRVSHYLDWIESVVWPN